VLAHSIAHPLIAKLKDHPAYLTYLKKEKSLSLRSVSSTSVTSLETSPEFMASLRSACDSIKSRMEEKLEEERKKFEEECMKRLEEKVKERMQEVIDQRDRHKKELELIQQEAEQKNQPN
jgi:C4-dicarboxylate-specific signal transduction histidine kinase